MSISQQARKLKKSRQKNSWNQINQFFFVKLHFWPFLKLQKMEFGQKKIFFLKLNYLISWVFLAWTFSKFLAPTVNYKMHLGNFGAPHIHTMLKNSCSAKLHTTFLTLQTLYLFFYVFVQILIYSFLRILKEKQKQKNLVNYPW